MTLLTREPLSRHTSFRIGGPAELFALPDTVAEAIELLRRARADRRPVLVLGGGSNLLVGDRGFPGLVLATRRLARICLADGRLRAECGARIPDLLRFCLERGLGGLEFWAGIPGTVGGAVVMNAGTAAGCAADAVYAARGFTGELEEVVLPRAAIDFRYRGSSLEQLQFLASAELAVERERFPGESKALIAAAVGKRRAAQPLGVPSAGSVFKNPPGDYAGRLVEAAGCRGWREGAAQVSPRHANFIVNLGDARAADVLKLVERVRARVWAESGIRLELEIRVV